MEVQKTEVKKSKLKTWFLHWGKFNLSLYFKDFKLSTLYWLLALTAVVVLFQSPIKKLLNYIIIDPVISFCPQNVGADLVFGIYLILSIVFLIRQLSKHIVPTFNSLLFGITIIVLYLVFFKIDSTYTFYHFTSGIAENYSFASIFLISSLVIVFSYKSYLNPLEKKPSQYSLLDDYPSSEKYIDIYGRSGYAASVAKHIEGTSSDVSFAIGIIGDWGSGKSDFLIRLKAALKDNDENIIFDFNPWRVNKADAIIDEFFKALSKQLKPYNQSIANTINDYSSRVLKTARETQFKLIDALIGGWFQEDDIQERYDTINESIKATSKRIVIFIDDVDRLTGKEVMEVLRIIRNTANFANTFFVVGIDQNYIISVLKNTKDFANEEEYLKKVFQLTITLPAFKKEVFGGEIKKHLFTPDMDETYQRRLTLALTRFGVDADATGPELFFPSFDYESLLERMIDNIRDLKRFCNSFKIVFNILKDEADLHDLIMLELIRNKSIEVYNSIRSRKILNWEMDTPNKLILDKKEWPILENQLPEKDKESIKRAVEFLFTDTEYKNQRKLILSHNFYIYFSYQLFNLISFHDFNQVLEKEADEIVSTFQKWIEEDKEKELFKIISYLDDFEDGNSFKKIIIVLLRLWKPGTNWFDQAKQMVYFTWSWNHKKYFQSNNDQHKEFLCSILNDESIDIFIRANLAHQFLRGMIENTIQENSFFVTKKELRNIIYCLFDRYLQSDKTEPLKTLEFYYLNDYKVVNEMVVRFPPACRRFKKYLLSNDEGLKGYVSILLRPSQFPYNGGLVLEPYIEQIFPDWKVFETKLSSTVFADTDMNRLKKIILKYLPSFFTSGRRPFKIQDKEDSAFIDNFLSLKRRNE